MKPTRAAWLRTVRESYCKNELRRHDKLLRAGKESVTIYRSDETGELVWAICVTDSDCFWMEALPTKKDALELCRACGWPVKGGKA